MSDVVIFFRHNFKVMLEACNGPEMGAMMSGIGIEPIMNYINVGYRRYQDNKTKRKEDGNKNI